jgi:hypothetical protein
MPTHKNTEPTPVAGSTLGRQERRFLQQIHRTADQECATDAFLGFMESAKPTDISRLCIALSDYNFSREMGREMSLSASAEWEDRPTAEAENPEAAASAPSEPAGGDNDSAGGEIPAWATNTPAETSYDLTMFDADGGEQQSVDLSRDEFIALKTHLAKMRGFEVDHA